MKRLAFFLVTLFFAGTSAAGIKYVAVVETGIDERSGAAAQITSAEAALMTAELRREAVNNLPRDRYSVMTSETVQSMGGAVLEECSEENCVITLGSRIGADYIVRGTVSKFQTKFTLSVEMYETENGTLVASSDPVRSEKPAELLEMAAGACANMYRKFAGAQGYAGRPGGAYSQDGQYPQNHQYEQQPQHVQQPQHAQRKRALTVNVSPHLDFSAGRRLGTWALNVLPYPLLCPTGLGSFTLMKDYVGGSIILGSTVAGYICILLGVSSSQQMGFMALGSSRNDGLIGTGIVIIAGNNIFNIIRSATYQKPLNKVSATASNFNPYDGLKLSVAPTESGDFKVSAHYDFTF